MPLTLHIPDNVAQAIKVPDASLSDALLLELGVILYSDGALSFGKARELSGVGRNEFSNALAKHNVPRHYTAQELEDDLAYASGGK